MNAISTEGRIFVAQLTRDVAARARAGARRLSPGAEDWDAAFRAFALAVSEARGPLQSAEMFRAALKRLKAAQGERACFLNASMQRKRSAFMEVLTYVVSQHPLTHAGYEGVAVQAYRLLLQRNGRITLSRGGTIAFLSWHALARMSERSSKIDIFDASGLVAGCGWAAWIMIASEKHHHTEINFAVGDIICTGVLRLNATDRNGFYDVLTALPLDDEYEARQPARVRQGNAIFQATLAYVNADNADPRGYADQIAVIPFRDTDYVSRELARMENEQ